MNAILGMEATATAKDENDGWKLLDIRIFTKLEVECTCKNQPPIDFWVKVVNPWTD
jgi:hypothetical protein